MQSHGRGTGSPVTHNAHQSAQRYLLETGTGSSNFTPISVDGLEAVYPVFPSISQM